MLTSSSNVLVQSFRVGVTHLVRGDPSHMVVVKEWRRDLLVSEQRSYLITVPEHG